MELFHVYMSSIDDQMRIYGEFAMVANSAPPELRDRQLIILRQNDSHISTYSSDYQSGIYLQQNHAYDKYI